MLRSHDVRIQWIPAGMLVLVASLGGAPLGCGGGQGETGGSSSAAGGSGGSPATGGTGGAETTSTTTTATTSTTTTGTGGSGPVLPFACGGIVPTGPAITDFAGLDYGNRALGWWGVPADTTFWGGLYVYGPGLAADSTSEVFAVSGMVSDYSGFGTWFGNCSDASAYEGVGFHIAGNAGAGKLQVWVMTNATFPITPADKRGACEYASELTKYSDCVYPSTLIAVPEGGGDVTLLWADFGGGKPVAAVNPKEILGLQWSFAWAGADTPYEVNVAVDDVTFLSSGGGSGGSGMGGSGGSGMGGGMGGGN